MWAWHHLVCSITFSREDRKYLLEKKARGITWSVQLLSRGKIENTCWKKKLVPQLGIEPLPFACEASALTTEPS